MAEGLVVACMTDILKITFRIHPMHHRDVMSSILRKLILLVKKKRNRANFSRGWQVTPFLPGEVMIDVLTPGCVSAGLGEER